MNKAQHAQSDAIETVQFLVGSEVRVQLLESLREQRQDARTLVERLDVPHSTVQRNLTKLEDRGWIDVTVNRRYYATPVGEMVLDALDGVLETVEAVDGLAAFVDCIPFDEFDLDLEEFATATSIVADDDTPAAPLSELVELLADAKGFALVTPHWNPAFREVIDRQLEAGSEVKLITQRSQQELLTGNGVTGIQTALDDERLTVKLTDDSLAFGVAVVPDEVALLGYQDGALRVLVRSANPGVQEWARAHLNSTDSAASPLQSQAEGNPGPGAETQTNP